MERWRCGRCYVLLRGALEVEAMVSSRCRWLTLVNKGHRGTNVQYQNPLLQALGQSFQIDGQTSKPSHGLTKCERKICARDWTRGRDCSKWQRSDLTLSDCPTWN